MSRSQGKEPTLEQAQKSYSADQGVSMHVCLACVYAVRKDVRYACRVRCTLYVGILLHSLSLSLGVRVTVDVTDTTCALKHDARDLRIPKWMRPSSGAHMPRISVARLLPTASDGDRACPYKG